MEYLVWCVGGLGRDTPWGHAANGRDELVDLVPHEQAAVAGLGTLAVLDLDGAGVFLHLGNGVDDLVPAEIAGRDLENDVLEEAGAQQARRTAALARAHAHRHVQLLVEVGHAHLDAFPHVRGKRAEGHAADNQRVNLADRRLPAVLLVTLDLSLGREHATEQGAHLELVAARVERRVGEHGDADELDLVEQGLAVVPAAAARAGLAAAVVLELQRGGVVLALRLDGVVRADHVAHGAADARIGRVRALTDAVEGGKGIGRLFGEPHGRVDFALAEHAEFNGVDRTDRGATPALGARVRIPVDLPGQVLDA